MRVIHPVAPPRSQWTQAGPPRSCTPDRKYCYVSGGHFASPPDSDAPPTNRVRSPLSPPHALSSPARPARSCTQSPETQDPSTPPPPERSTVLTTEQVIHAAEMFSFACGGKGGHQGSADR